MHIKNFLCKWQNLYKCICVKNAAAALYAVLPKIKTVFTVYETVVGFLDDIAEKIQSLLSDEESMRQIKELAAMFSGSSGNSGDSPSPFSETDSSAATNDENTSDGLGINPLVIMQLMGAISASDKNCDLLIALRPHLGDEKQRRLDKMLKFMKLYNIFITMRDSGMLNDLDNIL